MPDQLRVDSPVTIYVVSELRHLARAAKGELTWWCVTRRSMPGDIGIIYWIQHGITCVIRFQRFIDRAEYCDTFGMATGEIRVVQILEPPIASRQLREDPRLRNIRAVRRSFQARWFGVEEEYAEALLDLLGTTIRPQRGHAPKDGTGAN